MREDDHNEIRILIDKVNDAWIEGPSEELFETLLDCFHPDMVIRGQGFEPVARGREACIRSYDEFARSVNLRSATLSEPVIDLAGDTATATYQWQVAYERGGDEYSDSGQEVVVAARGEGRWRIVWRAVLPGVQVKSSDR